MIKAGVLNLCLGNRERGLIKDQLKKQGFVDSDAAKHQAINDSILILFENDFIPVEIVDLMYELLMNQIAAVIKPDGIKEGDMLQTIVIPL